MEQDASRLRVRRVTPCRVLVPIALAAWAGSGCNDAECEKARMELAKSWEELRNTATSRQQIPPATSLSASQKDERIRTWTEIEASAELLRSSFGTSQVTWSPAQKARSALGEQFERVAKTDDPVTQGFGTAMKVADQLMKSYDQRCR